MTDADPGELELMLNRFRRLFAELARGMMSRQTFLPWEVEIMVDFQECPLPGKRRLEILRQWERAVIRQLQSGHGPPMKLSAFLVLREERREKLRPAEPGGPQFDTLRSRLAL